jgi:FtsH-binding integral membrane protein
MRSSYAQQQEIIKNLHQKNRLRKTRSNVWWAVFCVLLFALVMYLQRMIIALDNVPELQAKMGQVCWFMENALVFIIITFVGLAIVTWNIYDPIREQIPRSLTENLSLEDQRVLYQ